MKNPGNVLVVGGGIAGIQASLDLADRGFNVYLVEKTPSIGGRMAQLDKTFPTMDCSICILAPKMIDVNRRQNIRLLTFSEVKEVRGEPGNFAVKVLRKSRFVDEEKCNGCGECVTKCPVKVPDEFDMELRKREAIHLYYLQGVPSVMSIDRKNCLYLTRGVCRICEKICSRNAIDFEQKDTVVTLNVEAIIVATGFVPFDPSNIKEYGYGKHKNVLTSMELERLLSASGPTDGNLVRPSDNKIPHKIAFIQCVGSRSLKDYYPYCSSVCCMYATKEAALIKEHERESEVSIFYTDIRAFGKGFREFVNRAKKEWGIEYFRAKPSEIREDPKTLDLTIKYEDTLTGEMKSLQVDLVILCTALVPPPDNKELAETLGIRVDEYGFFQVRHPLLAPLDATAPGIFLSGCCHTPQDIPDSVAEGKGAATRAVEFLARMRS